MNEAAVRIEGLTKIYSSRGNTKAVDDLNLTIGRGEIFGLLGPNGAGKTTTVRMICGLIKPTAGSVYVDGISVADEPSVVRSRIGLLPEDAGDYKNLTLAEELAYHGAMYGMDAATVRRRSLPLLDRLGLVDRANDRLKTFSRGMRRKFHVIRAVLHEPRLLLLDEPTAGLDPSIVEEVWDLLKALAVEHHVTVILCSHHLEEVERLCSRVAIVRSRLLVQGSLAELSGGENRYVFQLVGDASPFVQPIRQISGVLETKAENSTLHFRITGNPQEIIPEIVRQVVAAGGQVLGLRRNDRDLRSLYRASTGNGAEGTHE
ncbi:MAG TPA: ABC transporter ATP-binding protein [Tepidisphaeraceae bacterium]|nr:ABC transporter ATP-binding protein [Tepidisphaeraceae bacterium]